MVNLDKSLIDFCEESFGEFVSSVYVKLGNNNEEYKKLINNKNQILKQFPNLKTVISECTPVDLTKEEVSKLLEIIELENLLHNYEEKELFLTAMRECCKLLILLDLIKD